MTKINAYAVQVLLAVNVIAVCRGQVNVTVGGIGGAESITAVEHDATTIMCQYVIDPGHSNTLVGLQWKIGASNAGSDSIGSISSGGAVSYDAPYNAPDYVISSTDTNKGCNLTIQNTSLADNGTYRCAVSIREPSLVTYYGNARMEVRSRVPVNSFMMEDEDGNSIKENSAVFLDSNKASYMFSFVVPGIYPGIAAFMWTVGGTKLPEVRLPDVPDEAGLITSSSSTSLTPKNEYHEKRLQCQAMDRDGKVVASLGVILDITLPVPTTPPPEPTQPTGTDGKPTEVPTTPPEPTQPTGTDGKPTEATDQPLSVAAIAGISCGCVLAGLCLIGIGIYLCYTYDCCIWCGEHCPWCREHCSCCRKPPKDGGNRDENIGMNNTGDSEEDQITEKDQDNTTKRDPS